MKKCALLIFFLVCCFACVAQTTYINGDWSKSNGEQCGRLKSVEVKTDGVIVTIEVKAVKALRWLRINYSSNTYIYSGGKRILLLSGLLENGEIKSCDNRGWSNVAYGETRSYQLYFAGHLPSGVTNISVIDDNYYGGRGYCFRNFNITNTNQRKNYLNYQSEYAVKQHIDQNNDGLCGIYEPIDDSGAKVACVKNGDEHALIFLSAPSSYSWGFCWTIGDIKAKLRNTASGGIFKAEWYNADKSENTMYVSFDGITMTAAGVKSEKIIYLKTYPTSNSGVTGSGSNKGQWSGTGFALNNGYIVTNNHVIDGATTIKVQGVRGTTDEYTAKVVSVDKNNDIAVIRITDNRFPGFGSIPYTIKRPQSDVGADVFVLGYPLPSYMGDEIKLTNGIISAKSGYQGDVTTYQISAPVQPGNSGGPMFDKDGNVIGIVNAGIPGAENVGYAIKTTYLLNLIDSSLSNSIIPSTNQVAGKSLTEKIKVLRNFVFFIKCN